METMLSVSLMPTLARSASVDRDMMEIHSWDVMISTSAATRFVEEMQSASTLREALTVAVNLITKETHLKDVTRTSPWSPTCAAPSSVDPTLCARMVSVCVSPGSREMPMM